MRPFDSPTLQLAVDDVADFALGCAVLGSGGGGEVRAAAHLLRATLRRVGPVALHDPTELADSARSEDHTALVGAVGSPTVMLEKLPDGGEFRRAIEALQDHLGVRFSALAPLEIGGVNGLLGVHAVATMGVDLLDGDAMGRAYPRLGQLVTLGTAPLAPLTLAEPGGGVLTLTGLADEPVETAVRACLPALGTWAAVCLQHSRLSMFADAGVSGSISRALRVGQALAARARREIDDRDLDDIAGVRTVFTGTVVDVRRTPGTLPTGTLTMVASPDDGSTLRIDFADEYVLALLDGEPVAWAPDIVQLLDLRHYTPVPVEQVRRGLRLRAVRLDAPAAARAHADRLGLTAYGLTGGF